MSVRDIILAAAGYQPVLHETTYTADGTANWPAGVTLDLHGIGGGRTSSTVGYTPAQYPTVNAYLNGRYTTVSGTPVTHNYTVPCTASGYPSSVDLVGTGLIGTNLTFNYPGGLIYANDDPSFGVNFGSDTFVLSVNDVQTGAGYVVAAYQGGFTIAGETFDTPLLGGGVAGVGISFANPVLSYSNGPVATLVVNGVTKTFAGQTAAGANTFTDFASVSTGATVSGAVTVPAGGSVRVRYYT